VDEAEQWCYSSCGSVDDESENLLRNDGVIATAGPIDTLKDIPVEKEGVTMRNADFINHISVQGIEYQIFDINRLEEKGIATISRLPFSIKILIENLLRKLDGRIVREEDLLNIAQ
jgi:hypothetical protein